MIPCALKDLKLPDIVIFRPNVFKLNMRFPSKAEKVVNFNVLHHETAKLRLLRITVKASKVSWPPLIIHCPWPKSLEM